MSSSAARQQFGERVALIELFGRAHLSQQFGRHGRSGLVMARVVGEYGRLVAPVLVELRGELDEIAGRCTAPATDTPLIETWHAAHGRTRGTWCERHRS